MTKPWPNSMYRDGQVSPDPLAFDNPPTQTDRVRAHQMVAQSFLGLAFFFGSQVMFWLPGIFQSVAGAGFDIIVNLVGIFCILLGIVGVIVAFKLSRESTFSPHITAAYKIVSGPKPTLLGRDQEIALIAVATTIPVFGPMVFSQVSMAHDALSILGVVAGLVAAGCCAAVAFQQMKRAIDITTAEVDRPV